MKTIKVDLCVIGAGSGGLSVAAGAAQMGADVALIERDKMGGDCLNYGCVPSKALLAAAKSAQSLRTLADFGIANSEPVIDFAKVQQHVQQVIATIAPHDSVERFTGLGVQVFKASAKFIDQHTVRANDVDIKAKYFVIATGSSPVAPPIPGLDQVDFLTNETIFNVTQQPEHLVVIGGGPIGCELAQAYRLLGSKVTLLEAFSMLPKDDADAAAVVRQALVASGVACHEGVKVTQVAKNGSYTVQFEKDGQVQSLNASHLLVAAGRAPNIDALDLDNANIKYTKKGIVVDKRLRTHQKRIFAIGDVAGGYQFTHIAGYHAGIVIRNALFRLPAKVDERVVPWVTYTTPELAQVGLHEAMAVANQIKHRVIKIPFSEVDRAQAEHDTAGFTKVIVSMRGDILGVTVVGAQAGELLVPWILAMQNRLKIGAIASMIVPYPARNDMLKKIIGEFYKPSLFSSRVRRVVKFLLKF